VLNEEEWCPKFKQIRLSPCTRPPLKKFVLEEIQKLLKSKNFVLSFSEKKREPDLEWCINVLSTLNLNHRFFKKDYYPSDVELGIESRKLIAK